MRRLLRRANALLVLFGFDLRQTYRSLRGMPRFFRTLRELRRQEEASGHPFSLRASHPCLGEDSEGSGLASGHYFHQDLLVARRIFQDRPRRHVDVGSRVDGFVAHLACFRRVEVVDIRPLTSAIPNITTIQADVMAPLPADLVESCDSVSCLHALEHFGLGRYGDPIDYDGHLLGLESLYSMLAPGGKLYLSVPIGPQRIEFNAHRVFSVGYLLGRLEPRYRVDRFSYVDDSGDLHEDVSLTEEDIREDFGCSYGCGIFELTKLRDGNDT